MFSRYFGQKPLPLTPYGRAVDVLPDNLHGPGKGKQKHLGKAIIAGGIAGGIEICITFPTEYVKTQLQLQARGTPKYNGIIHCAQMTVKEYGFFGLYKGLSPLFWMSIPKVAVRFGGFEMFRNLVVGNTGKDLTDGQQLLCGLGAGVTEAIFAVTPMETIKVKFIHDQTLRTPRYKGFVHGVSTIIKEEGIAGTYKGLFPTILKQGTNQMIRFYVYKKVGEWLKGDQQRDLKPPWETMFAGAVAGGASVLGNTPIDVVKTRMQGLEAKNYKGPIDCCVQIFKNEGPMAFYKGTGARLMRVCADVAIVFTLYEYTMAGLNYVWKT